MKLKQTLISALLVAFTLSQPAFALDDENKADMSKPQIMMYHDYLDKMLDKINLTDDQKTKIKALRDNNAPNIQYIKKNYVLLQTDINNLIYSDTIDEKNLDSLLEKRTKALSAMLKNTSMIKHQIYLILDSKQKAQLKTLIAEWTKKVQ